MCFTHGVSGKIHLSPGQRKQSCSFRLNINDVSSLKIVSPFYFLLSSFEVAETQCMTLSCLRSVGASLGMAHQAQTSAVLQ